MAHSSAPIVQEFPCFPQPKMLTLKWSDKTAMLVETIAGKRCHKPIPVADAKAALAWCEQHHVAFWYQPQPDPAAN